MKCSIRHLSIEERHDRDGYRSDEDCDNSILRSMTFIFIRLDFHFLNGYRKFLIFHDSLAFKALIFSSSYTYITWDPSISINLVFKT